MRIGFENMISNSDHKSVIKWKHNIMMSILILLAISIVAQCADTQQPILVSGGEQQGGE